MQLLNETIHHVLGIPAVLEPIGVCCDNSKRPDGIELIPWLNKTKDTTMLLDNSS